MSRASRVRGFTLVELLAVVAIVGILAAIGIPTSRAWLNAAKEEGEAKRMLPAIGGAEVLYQSEARVYLSCSDFPTDYYPHTTPDTKKWDWVQPSHMDAACWKMLGVTTGGPVHCVYSVVAGAPGEAPPPLPKADTVLGVQSDPWYLAVAACDVDGNGDQTLFWASSVDGDVREAK